MFLNASFNDPENEIYDYQYNSVFYYAKKENLDALIVSVGTIASFISQKSIEALEETLSKLKEYTQ